MRRLLVSYISYWYIVGQVHIILDYINFQGNLQS
jgi:hypothetical protein